MIDGIKIEHPITKEMRRDEALNFIGKHCQNTGEVLPLPTEARDYNLSFSKQKHNLTIQGSLHRWHNRGGENDNDYSLTDFKKTLRRLDAEFHIKADKAKIINFEFGVNIRLPIGEDAQVFQKYLVSAYTRAFEKMNPKRPMVGYIAEFNEFSIKIYDKGYQARTGATDQLRVEIKINRTRWLDQFGFDKGAELYLSDLTKQHNIKILGDILVQKVRSLIVTPRDLDIKKLSPKQRLTFYECRDARSWEEWNSKQRERKRKQLAAIFKTLNQPDPVDELAKLVEAKWKELTTVRRDENEALQPRKKATISRFIVDGIRVFFNFLLKKREWVANTMQYVVGLPRGTPLPRAPVLNTQSGFNRWIDLNNNSPPV